MRTLFTKILLWFLLTLALAFGLAVAGASNAATELVIATVNNGHMIEMQKLTKFFEQANPDITIKWATLGCVRNSSYRAVKNRSRCSTSEARAKCQTTP